VLVELWPIERPRPYPENARKWNTAAVDKVAASLRSYGFRQPLVVDAQDVIIIGHLRLAAAKTLRLKEVPVHIARDLTPAQVRGLRLMDNRSHEEAEWDFTLLVPELLGLSADSFDLSLTGFDVRELDVFLRDPMGEARADEAPPLPEIATTRRGDLWICGDHRVLCGDATDADAVTRLFGERRPALMACDLHTGYVTTLCGERKPAWGNSGRPVRSPMTIRSIGRKRTSCFRATSLTCGTQESMPVRLLPI